MPYLGTFWWVMIGYKSENKKGKSTMNSELRTSRLKKNILFSFLIKGWAGIIQLLLVPITLFCLGNYENGIWMTISSILIG